MARTAVPIELNDETRCKLQNIVNSQKTDQELGLQAQIVLLADQGLSNRAIAQRLSTNDRRVGRWRNRFADEGLDALKESPDRETTPAVDGKFELYNAPEENLLIEKVFNKDEELVPDEVCQPVKRRFCIAEREALRKISILGLAILFHLLLLLILSTPSLV